MDLTTLKAHIKTKKFDKYYIFTGPEVEVMRLYIEQMSKIVGGRKNIDSITDFVQKSYARTPLQNRSVIVIRDCKEFISDDSLQAKITQNNATGESPIVFVYSYIDKRSKLYKNFQDNIVEFNYLKPDVLVKYIQRDVKLSESSCKKLIEVCENDYSRILLEIDKIKRFCEAKSSTDQITPERAFEYLLEDGTINKPPRDAVFMFVDAVLRYRPKLAFELLEESYASGEATMVLLSNLYNSTKQLLQVQSYDGSAGICDVTGLTPFQAKLASGRKGVYSNGDLVYFMRLIRSAEKGIKTGEIEEQMAVPYVLVNMF
jgi:DNA polymerase III delta subunit